MDRYITLGADEHGQVYGLELNDDGTWSRNPLGYATSCVVISPMKKEAYDYITEDPESAKELWQQCVAAGQTEKGLNEWFEDYKDSGDLFDASFVSELLDCEDNPTVSKWEENSKCEENNIEDAVPAFESFREYVNDALINSEEVKSINGVNDVYEWESAGIFPPKKPFVVEFAPKELLEEYYAHLRKVGYKGWK